MGPLLGDFSVRIEVCVGKNKSDFLGLSLALDISWDFVLLSPHTECSYRIITIDLLIGMACNHIQITIRHAPTWYVITVCAADIYTANCAIYGR
jgi:hypothetical protein